MEVVINFLVNHFCRLSLNNSYFKVLYMNQNFCQFAETETDSQKQIRWRLIKYKEYIMYIILPRII